MAEARPVVRYCFFNGRYRCPQNFELVFGNIEEYLQEDIERYLDWLVSQYKNDKEVYEELQQLRKYFVPIWWAFADNKDYWMPKRVWQRLEKDGWKFGYGVVAGCGYGDAVIVEDNDKVWFVVRPCYCHPYSYFWQVYPPEKFRPQFIRLPDNAPECRAVLERHCKEREEMLKEVFGSLESN